MAPSIFSIVPDGAVRRRPSDLVRVALAAVVVALTGIAATNHLTDLEHDVYDFFTAAPTALDWVFRAGYWSLPAMVVAVIIGAIVGRHVRMVLTIVLAGAATVIAGFALDAAIGTKTSESLANVGADLTNGAPDYPPIALAVAAAAVLAAGPYLTRPTRRFAWILVLVSACSAVILVEGLPAAVIGVIALAWGLAAAAQFALGTPVGTPSLSEVVNAVDDLGLPIPDLALADDQTWGEAASSAPSTATAWSSAFSVRRDRRQRVRQAAALDPLQGHRAVVDPVACPTGRAPRTCCCSRTAPVYGYPR